MKEKNEEEKGVVTTLRLRPSLKLALGVTAKRNGMSMGELVEHALLGRLSEPFIDELKREMERAASV